MADIFVVSDTHFSHARTLTFDVPDFDYRCPNVAPAHVCGLSGFDPWLHEDTCPACDWWATPCAVCGERRGSHSPLGLASHCQGLRSACDEACQATHPTKKMRSFASVEEMDETIVARWNATVPPQAHVYHLGDVAFADGLRHVPRLNGHKRLVLGNHDPYDMRLLTAAGFKKIFSSREIDGMLLTHIPVAMFSLLQKVTWDAPGRAHREARFKVNVCGHVHNNVQLPAPYVNVCVEMTGYTPVPLDTIRQRYGLKHGGS